MLPAGHRLIRLDETTSTNDTAAGKARAGHSLPLWVIADRQSAGRGRRGRHWQSLAGNLLCSLAFDSNNAPPGLLALTAGLAVHDAVLQCTGGIAGLALKWPNDLMHDDAKLGGILAEQVSEGTPPLTVIGWGVNVKAHPAAEEVAHPATSLSALGAPVACESLFQALAEAFALRWQTASAQDGFAEIRTEWLARAWRLGEEVEIDQDGNKLVGIFSGLGEAGEMLLEDNRGKTRAVHAGDVASPVENV